MHHIDAHATGDGRWLACVDGFQWQTQDDSGHKELKMQTKALTMIKHRLRSSKAYLVASEIKGVLKKHLNGTPDHNKTISLKPHKPARGNVLLAYLTDAFLVDDVQTVPYGHPAYWESFQMAKTFVDFGYSVDVISAADAEGFTAGKKIRILHWPSLQFCDDCPATERRLRKGIALRHGTSAV